MRTEPTEPRRFTESDAEPARALVLNLLGGTPYADRALELVAATAKGDPECRGLVLEQEGSLRALVVYGLVAGVANAWRIMLLVLAQDVELRDIGRVVVEAVVDRVREDGARFLMAELPADTVMGAALTVLRASRFRQEARIADFFRDGVALLFLRREL